MMWATGSPSVHIARLSTRLSTNVDNRAMWTNGLCGPTGYVYVNQTGYGQMWTDGLDLLLLPFLQTAAADLISHDRCPSSRPLLLTLPFF